MSLKRVFLNYGMANLRRLEPRDRRRARRAWRRVLIDESRAFRGFAQIKPEFGLYDFFMYKYTYDWMDISSSSESQQYHRNTGTTSVDANKNFSFVFEPREFSKLERKYEILQIEGYENELPDEEAFRNKRDRYYVPWVITPADEEIELKLEVTVRTPAWGKIYLLPSSVNMEITSQRVFDAEADAPFNISENLSLRFKNPIDENENISVYFITDNIVLDDDDNISNEADLNAVKRQRAGNKLIGKINLLKNNKKYDVQYKFMNVQFKGELTMATDDSNFELVTLGPNVSTQGHSLQSRMNRAQRENGQLLKRHTREAAHRIKSFFQRGMINYLEPEFEDYEIEIDGSEEWSINELPNGTFDIALPRKLAIQIFNAFENVNPNEKKVVGFMIPFWTGTLCGIAPRNQQKRHFMGSLSSEILSASSGNYYNVETTIIHECGHTNGLPHLFADVSSVQLCIASTYNMMDYAVRPTTGSTNFIFDKYTFMKHQWEKWYSDQHLIERDAPTQSPSESPEV